LNLYLQLDLDLWSFPFSRNLESRLVSWGGNWLSRGRFLFGIALDAAPQSLEGFLARGRAQTVVISEPGQHGGNDLFRKAVGARFRFPGGQHALQASNDGAVVVAALGF
jgi:hypothetical protein